MKNETFTPERIKAEADAFFEWDGEDRSLVTTTSCLLFAQHIAGLMQARAAQPAPVVPECVERIRTLLPRFEAGVNWTGEDAAELAEAAYDAAELLTTQPAPSQDVAGLASSDPVAKAEFETRLRKEFESRWPKPKGVTWGAGINDYCVSEFAEGIALSYPDMWMAYKAGAMRTNQ